ncbi:MAG TPA: hypothetical protein VK541_14770 [Pedobacter sp.]|uniref:hypothetical protein n=1 Tax=Pedobacter sp. TaxID=1411316 RepID=UPI002B6B89BC|nr:hypothetical protein [Pedobacter sp.]HMI03744.1 hypothetical protein [Pedobacter sp.]
METNVRVSKKFELQWRDAIRGFIVAAITAALVVVQSSIESGSLVFNWNQIIMAAVGGGVAYLLKNWLLEPAKVITTTNNEQVEKVKSDIKEAL